VKSAILGPFKELLQIPSLLFQRNHFQADCARFLTKRRVRSSDRIDVPSESQEEQTRDRTEDAGGR
jgi:hypothetical protein